MDCFREIFGDDALSRGQFDRGISIDNLCYLIVVWLVAVLETDPPPDTVAFVVTECGAATLTFTFKMIGG